MQAPTNLSERLANNRNMILGAHVSTAGGLHNAIKNGDNLSCDAIQIFLQNPNQWQPKPIDTDGIEKFKAAWRESPMREVVAHDIHLSNLASPKPDVLAKSRMQFHAQMELAAQLGISGIVTHLGAHLGEGESFGLKRLTESFDECFETTDAPEVTVLLETTAGQGTNLGYRFEHLRDVIAMSRYPARFGVCFDTCHVFVAGYDMRTAADCEAVFAQFEEVIGLERLQVFHLNDAKSAYRSRVDRHAHIGEGNIGSAAFAFIVNDARFAEVPLIIETPEMKTMHAVNLATLRGLVE